MIKKTAIFVLAALAASGAAGQMVNAIVAVVNGQVITLLDVQVAAEFGLAGADEGTDPREAALDSLIDRKLVLDLAREVRSADRSEIAAAIADLKKSMGEGAFAAKLAKFGLREE